MLSNFEISRTSRQKVLKSTARAGGKKTGPVRAGISYESLDRGKSAASQTSFRGFCDVRTYRLPRPVRYLNDSLTTKLMSHRLLVTAVKTTSSRVVIPFLWTHQRFVVQSYICSNCRAIDIVHGVRIQRDGHAISCLSVIMSVHRLGSMWTQQREIILLSLLVFALAGAE